MTIDAALAAPKALPVGPGQTIADKYRIERLIDKGGMGAVFEARHVRIGRRVAIKMLHARLAEEAMHLARFEREACVCGALEHENVAAIYDIGRHADGRPFIVMEFVAGQTLRGLLEAQGEQSIPRAIGIIRQACRGLAAAHQQGVVHRDVKPENLIIGQQADGRDLVKVVDFGIARLLDGTEGGVNTGGVRLGTPHYMAPETAQAEVELDARVDVYALGVILFELLTGRKPYEGRTFNAVMYHIANSKLPDIRELQPHVPEALCRVVKRALCADRELRIGSCQELLAELEPFEATSRFSILPETNTTASDTVRSAFVQRPQGRLRRVALGVAAALALGGAFAAGLHARAPSQATGESSACEGSEGELATVVSSEAGCNPVEAALRSERDSQGSVFASRASDTGQQVAGVATDDVRTHWARKGMLVGPAHVPSHSAPPPARQIHAGAVGSGSAASERLDLDRQNPY